MSFRRPTRPGTRVRRHTRVMTGAMAGVDVGRDVRRSRAMRFSEGTLYALIVSWRPRSGSRSSPDCLFAIYCIGAASVGSFLSVPLIDLALLAFTVLDLRSGTNATFAHGLATAYVGFTVAFGPMFIRWADERFAHRFGGGPRPSEPPSRGWASVRYELTLWARCLLAVCIIHFLLFAVIGFVDQSSQTQALEIWYRIPLATAFFWFIFGPLWQLVFQTGIK